MTVREVALGAHIQKCLPSWHCRLDTLNVGESDSTPQPWEGMTDGQAQHDSY